MIVVEDAGMMTTVQDLGRPGYESQGVPTGGAADAYALRIANLLVGNDEGAAGLECTLRGPVLRFEQPAVVAVTGARPAGVPWGRPWLAQAGEHVDLRAIDTGCRAYVAVAGGIDVPVVMGSRSTYVRAAIGGLEGRALARGDRFNLGTGGIQTVRKGWGVRNTAPAGAIVLRVVRGPQWNWFSQAMHQRCLTHLFRIGRQSDRMGLRLEGAAVDVEQKRELVSEATALGSIQVPAGGGPIVLMADRPTIGGYAKIATVIAADISKAAQARPGDAVRFAEISIIDAERLFRDLERDLETLRIGVRMQQER